MESDDGWRHDTPTNIHILFIEGYCQVPWMETSYLQCPPITGDVSPFNCHTLFRVWCTDPSYLDENTVRAISEIKSGRYHETAHVHELLHTMQKNLHCAIAFSVESKSLKNRGHGICPLS